MKAIDNMEHVLFKMFSFKKTITPHSDLPARSRLYNLAPIGVGTPVVESLTSYINRLAWLYRISPRILVAEEIIPHLNKSYYFQSSPHDISNFCQQEAISINSFGETAVDWSATIEGLTQRTGLQKLTLGEWANGIPSRRLLRIAPAWCPACYATWQEKNLPIYQPLIWMLQIVTFCTQHNRKLEEQCNHCHKRQSVFSSIIKPGHCTQCGVWLGLSAEVAEEPVSDEEELVWQNWVVKNFDELRAASVNSDGISWRRISINFAASLEVKGEAARFSRLLGVSEKLISQWKHLEKIPSFQKVLEICYAVGTSPLQLMSDTDTMRNVIQAISAHLRRRPVHHRRQVVDREEIREYLLAVLDGRKPCRPMYQIERDLGVGFRTIERIFPLECSLVSSQHLAQRAQAWKQRIDRACEEVRLVASALHAQGIYPSYNRVGSQLSKPNMMRMPEIHAAWSATLRELGLKE